jgi:hypothetical protein
MSKYVVNHSRNIAGKRYQLWTTEKRKSAAELGAKELRVYRGWLARIAIVDPKYTDGERVWGIYAIDTRDREE